LDEEIVPNPKATFSNGSLPKLRRRSKGPSNQEQEGMSSAPCCPITSGGSKSEGELSPRAYNDLRSQLPQNPASLEWMARRPGASTRLKGIAMQEIEGTVSPVDGGFKDGESVDAKANLQTQRANTRFQTLRRASRFNLTIGKGDNSNTLVQTTAMRPDVTAKRCSRGTRECAELKSTNP